MINFFKKQFFKIAVYIIILVLLNGLWFFSEWNISILVSLNSLITSLFTFIIGKTWLEDYKLEVNKELEKYKIKLSSYTLVTKLQYDLEFRIYTEVYGMLKNYFDILIIIYKDLYIQSREKLKKSIDTYETITVTITDYTYKNKPFYEKKIFNKIEKIIALSNEMWLMSRNHMSGKLVSLVIFEHKIKELQVHLDELSDLIRQRIENMKIIED